MNSRVLGQQPSPDRSPDAIVMRRQGSENNLHGTRVHLPLHVICTSGERSSKGGRPRTKGCTHVAGRVKDLLDDQVDAVAATTPDTLVARIIIASLCALLLAGNVSLIAGGVWGCSFVVCEAWTWAVCKPVIRGGALTRRERQHYLVILFASGSNWSLLAALYWWAGSEPYHLIAFTVLAGVLVHAQHFCFRAPAALGALAVPPVVAMVGLPLFHLDYSGMPLATLVGSTSLLMTYVAVSATSNMRTAQALEAAQREAVAANDAKSAFLAVMSHELRTPLNGVLGMARAVSHRSGRSPEKPPRHDSEVWRHAAGDAERSAGHLENRSRPHRPESGTVRSTRFRRTVCSAVV